jgi:methylase of polypeptide subunit release factors
MLNHSHEYIKPNHWHALAHSMRDQTLIALHRLLHTMTEQGYKFTAVTPTSHERFLSRTEGTAKNTRDIFGWNLPFKAKLLSPPLFDFLNQAQLFTREGDYFRSKVRISSLGNDLFLHSSYPTDDAQSVFFGPDTYRFARFIKQTLNTLQFQSRLLKPHSPLKILDVGCGSGAGAIAAIRALPQQQVVELMLNDVNSTALDYAAVCAQVAEVPVVLLHDDFFNINQVQYDLIVSNPPFIEDSAGRVYRNGGTRLGLDLSLRIVKHALQLLAPGGHLLLYTGVAMTSCERNPLLAELIPYLSDNKFRWTYEEIDPDIFGEELEKPAYHNATRIAAVGLTIMRMN